MSLGKRVASATSQAHGMKYVDKCQHIGNREFDRVARSHHPNKEIEAAVAYAESLGWRVVPISGHAWGRLYCPWADRNGCMVSVWSTPRNAENQAKAIRRDVARCPYPGAE